MSEKVRVHTLAKTLNVASKEIVVKCQAEGLDVANHMSTLSAGLAATIREWFSEGQHATTIETSARVDLQKVRVKRKPNRTKLTAEESTTETKRATKSETKKAVKAEAAAAEIQEEVAEAPVAVAEAPAAPPAVAEAPPAPGEVDSEQGPPPVEAPATEQASTPDEALAEAIAPAGPQNVPAPAQLKGPRVVRYEPVEEAPAPFRHRRRPPAPVAATPLPISRDEPPKPRSDAPGRGRQRSGAPEPGGGKVGSPGRGLSRRAVQTGESSVEKLREWRDRDLAERQERISDATGRKIHARRVVERGQAGAHPAPPKTEATVHEPIILRDLCAATGVSMMQMLPVLRRDCGLAATINMELPADAAELVADSFGINLTITPAKTELDLIQEEFDAREPKSLEHRPPVVTFLGHVDHGKTSLLDAIRATHVTATEDGGITQHIGAYQLDHKAGRVTFLDTPGHAAFTAMRARGAQMTDVAVLVVAADDGVMPQTVEAINHAKSAGVPVVVALNKIDLGDRNVTRIYGQLSEHGLTPGGDWGGETDVIQTAATTGQGVDELVEHLVALGDVLDLKADCKGDAAGTVIEAETKEGVGPVVRVLVQRGMLRTGAILVCGNAFGKARALLDDRGGRVNEAGPSMPVEVWGLDEVPLSGDKFFQVKSMQRAKTIGEDARRRRVQGARAQTRRLRSLEEVFKQRDESGIPELNVIIKADVDGSLDALRTMLLSFPADRVRLVIRHAAVGAVTDSDVLLADASNAIIIAFRVIAVPGAKRRADDKGVDLRDYKVIYEVSDEIKKALEGLLVPDEECEVRSNCEVRDVFSISKVGTVAGCIVTDGTIERSHMVRLTRDGVVVVDGNKIASLRRFKDDVKEVRSGMECGIRIERFDDIKKGDIIQAYEVIKIPQTL